MRDLLNARDLPVAALAGEAADATSEWCRPGS